MITQVKDQIQQLPDAVIGELVEWLNSYYDGEVWDRQMAADIERMGDEEWERRLVEATEDDGGRRAAILRLMNALEPTTDEKRALFLKDLFFVVGDTLENFQE